MQATESDHAPPQLWVFVLGSTLYALAPLLPQLPYMPVNPFALMAVATAGFLMRRKENRSYWATVTLAFMAIWYPHLVFAGWVGVSGHPTLLQILWMFVTPPLLLCLLLAPRVRRFAHLRSRDSDPPAGNPAARPQSG